MCDTHEATIINAGTAGGAVLRGGSMRLRRRALVATIASFSMVSAGLLGVASPAAAAEGPEWLERLNSYRVAAGVAPVAENAEWTAGIAAHLRYLRLTPTGYRTGAFESAHTENPDSPYYTPEGDAAGRSSNLVWGGAISGTEAIDVWMRAPFHAIGILRARLTESAFSQEGTAAGLDVLRGIDNGLPRPTEPVLFPGPASSTSLARFAGESPNPLETCRYTSAGLPLIAMLPSPAEPGIQATLQNPEGETASIGDGLCVVTADNYVSSDPVYGPTGRSILKGDNAVLVIPREPLHRGTYTVTVTQPTRGDITWSFTSTAPPLRPPQPPPKPAHPKPTPAVHLSTPASGGTALRIDVDPSVGSTSWTVRILKKTGTRYVKTQTVRTKGSAEIVTVPLRPGYYKIRIPAQHGHRVKVVATRVLAKPTVRLSTPNKAKVRVDVNPNLQGAKSWQVRIQKKKNGKFVTVRTVSTRLRQEIAVANVPRGRYRVYVPAQHGRDDALTRQVFVKR